MSGRSAFLIILLALVAGVIAGWFRFGSTGVDARYGVVGLPLHEAKAAGIIDDAKRKAIIDRVIAYQDLSTNDILALQRVRSGCLNFTAGRRSS
ncbi:MAG: hypothetical protein AAF709_16340 [Pseudomonadota bacterium]